MFKGGSRLQWRRVKPTRHMSGRRRHPSPACGMSKNGVVGIEMKDGHVIYSGERSSGTLPVLYGGQNRKNLRLSILAVWTGKGRIIGKCTCALRASPPWDCASDLVNQSPLNYPELSTAVIMTPKLRDFRGLTAMGAPPREGNLSKPDTS